ncbi:MAG: hypothetical protein ACKVJE_17940 [Pseudomonadales bacterium]|jgi:hypothetical protein
MANEPLEEEEKVLLELLKWSGGPEDDKTEKGKSRIQAYAIAVILFLISIVLFYLDTPSKYQVFGGLAFIAGVAFVSMATIITGAAYNLKYTEKYIDTDAVRERLKEIKLNKPRQQRPSGWTH